MPPRVEEIDGDIVFPVHLVPGAKADRVVGWTAEGRLKVRVRARPVEGAANRALLVVLAENLKVRPRDLQIVAGEKARLKTLRSRGNVRSALMALPEASDGRDRGG